MKKDKSITSFEHRKQVSKMARISELSTYFKVLPHNQHEQLYIEKY